ncbi:MAG: sigma 54-interacting transcriptional regulator [Rectinemataceae bacterium]
MSPASFLSAPSGPESARILFELARGLSLRADLRSFLVPALRILREATGASFCFAAFAEMSGLEVRLLAIEPSPGPNPELSPGSPLRMGLSPGGTALERAEVSVVRGAGGECRIEAPICQGESVRGVIVASFAPPFRADETETAKLFGAAALLFEEALALRRSLGYDGFGLRAAIDTIDTIDAIDLKDAKVAERGAATEAGFAGMIGRSAPMRELFSLIQRVAGSDATVLVSGESGTGKELVARAVHALGDRASGPFIAVNCAALPESVIESELFGHEKGSFTGAYATRRGRFELAHDGTLFLDEIGDLPPAIQVKLLRILQERSFERVGGSHSIRTNARIVVATNRDLAVEVREKRFREDLYFRLNVFPIHVPPLRERGADIVLLADHFAERSGSGTGSGTGKKILRISTPAIDLFMTYHWPGNVRELENCIERAAILSSDGVIHAFNLPPSLQSAESTDTGPSSTMDGAIARLEKEMLIEALKLARGNSAAAARRLGVTERRFRLGLDRYKIDWRRFRTVL